MTNIAILICLLISAPILWLAIKLLAAYAVAPETSGLLYFKQSLSSHGIDITLIPDSCLSEIVAQSIKVSKFMANFAPTSEDKNWRANLVRSLDNKAIISVEIFRGRDVRGYGDDLTEIYRKYRVI